MPAYRFPILIWEDFEGYFTASLVEGSFAQVGIGQSAAEAVLQLKEFLAWWHEKNPWHAEPDFLDARLIHFKVEVRPEYRIAKQIYPADKPLALRVPCVHGRQASGLLVCALPTLDIHFYYYDPKVLKDLAVTYVQENLKGLTPRELSRYLPAKSVRLDEIVLQVARKEKPRHDAPALATLNEVAEPLGDRRLKKQYSAAWERERETADLVARLGKEKANVILLGESGVGKTTVLANAVREVEKEIEKSADADDDAPAGTHRFWLTSGARLIAGMRYLGQWEARCERLIRELSDIGGALCVGNLLDLILTGGREPSASIAAFLLPYIQRGELRLVAEATPAELDACRRLLPGLAGLFQILNLPEFTRQQAHTILRRALESLKRNYRLEAADGIAALVYRLFNRFAPYQAFPARSLAFLRALFERARLDQTREIAAETVVAQFVRQTGLPELFLRDDMRLAFEDVMAAFNQQVIGQVEPCRAAASLVTTFKAGLNDPARPVGVLMFCGPTGVGKTELAKAISKFFFGHGEQKDRLIRLDMSEYSGPGAAERLITGAQGEPSDIIKRVRQQPFVVVLLDEIEKADAAVFDVLLGVFDEGRLTDRYGRTTTFRSAVIIMTSNLGADKMGAVGFDRRNAPSYEAEAMAFFRPEFFNRIDAVVRFNALDEGTILAITKKELAAVARREGLVVSGTRITWADALVERIARAGYDTRYGARPLQRTIEQMIVAPLARLLVERPELKGTSIEVDLSDEGLVIA